MRAWKVPGAPRDGSSCVLGRNRCGPIGRAVAQVACLIACQFAASPATGFEPGRGPPGNTGPPAAAREAPPPATDSAKTASTERLNVDRGEYRDEFSLTPPAEPDRWHQNLLRERQTEVRLRAAKRDAESGRLVDALSELQAIIDRDDDLFVRDESESIPRGAHFLAGRIIGSLSAEGLAVYESLFGPQAQKLLEAGTPVSEPDRLGEIIRRFYHTAAGFEAGNRLAAWWADHGCDEMAWGWWQRVLAEPAHRLRLRPVHRAQAAYCARRVGRPEDANAIAAAIETEPVTIGGRSQFVTHWLNRVPFSAAVTAGAIALSGAADEGDSSETGSAPALRHVLWQSGLAGEKSRHIETLARAWERYQLQIGLPVGTSQFPVVVGSTLVYRDFEALRAVELRTGRPLWSYACASSLSREISPQQTAPVDGNPDPQNVMRTLVGNCLMGTLASDQRCVFAIDRLELDEQAAYAGKPAASDEAGMHRKPSNVLLAIEIPEQRHSGAAQETSRDAGEARLKWTAGGPEADHGQPLAGHFFLGPPLAVAERLFAVSEWNQQLYLSCLKAESGRVLWSQTICALSQPISVDYQRFALICSPIYGEGVVLCPTQSGVLVAVDSLSGKLLWAASHDGLEPHQKQQMSGWPYSARKRYGHPGYLNLPLVADSSVVYLPAHSEHVHCLDLKTGCLKWRAAREDLEPSTATEYVATVASQTVVVVGRRRCRGLDLTSGTQRWSVRLGSSPSGRGARIANQYHVPLDDGKLVSLDLESGRVCGVAPAVADTRLGNLVAGREEIVSFGLDCIAVFPQARQLAQRLESAPVAAATAPARLLDAAELDLTLGRFDRAAARIEDLIERAPETPEAARAGALFCELLVGRLSPEPARRDRLIGRMAALAGRGARGTCLFERCRAAFERGDATVALAAARELASFDNEILVGGADDPSRLTASDVAATLLAREIVRDATAIGIFERQLAADLAHAFPDANAQTLRRLVRVGGDSACADDARLKLAGLLAGQGRAQEAETLLLACRESTRLECAAQATRRLAELWELRGLDHEAGRLLAELAGKFSATPVAAGQTGAQWLATLPRENRSVAAWRQLAPPVWPGAGVRISEQRISDDRLQSIYNGNGVQYLATPRSLPFDLFDQGRGSAMLLRVVDRQRGIDYPETIHLPGRPFYPVSMQQGYVHHSFVGNLVPVGGAGAFHGVSLLERRLLWTTVPRELEGVKDVVRVGPAGPGFCVFQNRHRLYVLDPLDGRVLWQRNDIEAAAGLMSTDPALGIIGDSRVLVVFGSNGANYTVYETASGAELRRGKLDIQARMLRRAMGRRLFHYTAAAESQRVRVWDALSDRMLWDEPAGEMVEASVFEGVSPGTKVAQFVRECEEFAFVTVSGRIRVVDLASGEQRFELTIDRRLLDNLSSLRAFRDRQRYYFSLQHALAPGQPAPADPGNFIADASIPCVHLQGDLCAYDAKAQRVLWERPLGNRSLLHLPDFPLPVLISLCRVRKQDQSHLDVEVLDVQTGETLCRRDDLFSDRLVQVAYDRQAGQLALRGAKTVIRFEFPTAGARLSAGDMPR